jgi:hypothetical protein
VLLGMMGKLLSMFGDARRKSDYPRTMALLSLRRHSAETSQGLALSLRQCVGSARASCAAHWEKGRSVSTFDDILVPVGATASSCRGMEFAIRLAGDLKSVCEPGLA